MSSTPVKRRAVSVKLRRDDSRNRRISAATVPSEQKTTAFETVPLISRRPVSSVSAADADDDTFKVEAAPSPCRLSIRERRRCLSAEDPTRRSKDDDIIDDVTRTPHIDHPCCTRL